MHDDRAMQGGPQCPPFSSPSVLCLRWAKPPDARLPILGSVAEFETDIRKERQREGIERAKAAGVYKGRKRSVDIEQVRSLRDQGLGATAIATKLGIGRASVYRALNNEAVALT